MGDRRPAPIHANITVSNTPPLLHPCPFSFAASPQKNTSPCPTGNGFDHAWPLECWLTRGKQRLQHIAGCEISPSCFCRRPMENMPQAAAGTGEQGLDPGQASLQTHELPAASHCRCEVVCYAVKPDGYTLLKLQPQLKNLSKHSWIPTTSVKPSHIFQDIKVLFHL